MDFQVVFNNFGFLILQGFFGFGAFVGGTLRLALPAIVLGFILGTFIGLARLARARWINLPARIYVEFFRGVPLVMVIFWFWFIIPTLAPMRCQISGLPKKNAVEIFGKRMGGNKRNRFHLLCKRISRCISYRLHRRFHLRVIRSSQP